MILTRNRVEAVVKVITVALVLERPQILVAVFKLEVMFVTGDLLPLAGPAIVLVILLKTDKIEFPLAVVFNTTEFRDERSATVDALKFGKQPALEENFAR